MYLRGFVNLKTASLQALRQFTLGAHDVKDGWALTSTAMSGPFARLGGRAEPNKTADDPCSGVSMNELQRLG